MHTLRYTFYCYNKTVSRIIVTKYCLLPGFQKFHRNFKEPLILFTGM